MIVFSSSCGFVISLLCLRYLPNFKTLFPDFQFLLRLIGILETVAFGLAFSTSLTLTLRPSLQNIATCLALHLPITVLIPSASLIVTQISIIRYLNCTHSSWLEYTRPLCKLGLLFHYIISLSLTLIMLVSPASSSLSECIQQADRSQKSWIRLALFGYNILIILIGAFFDLALLGYLRQRPMDAQLAPWNSNGAGVANVLHKVPIKATLLSTALLIITSVSLVLQHVFMQNVLLK